MPAHLITQAELKEILHYDPETGVFTWRKVGRMGRAKSGSVAGTVNNHGYVSICLFGKKYQAHRLAFLMMDGVFPIGYVDHINQTRHDNRWENLRHAERGHADNIQNMKFKGTNTSGYTGVIYIKNEIRNKQWRAQIKHNYKSIIIGYFDNPEDAHLAYLAKKRELHSFFTG